MITWRESARVEITPEKKKKEKKRKPKLDYLAGDEQRRCCLTYCLHLQCESWRFWGFNY